MSKFKIGDNVWHVDPFFPKRKAIITKEHERDGEFDRFEIKFEDGISRYVYDEEYLQLRELEEQDIHLNLQDAMKGCNEIEINDGVITELKHCDDITAAGMLQEAKDCLVARGVERDKPDGERSMKSTVEAFNTLTGHVLTEEQGWLFMTTLKMARSQGGCYKADDYIDMAAYAALAGEAAAKEAIND